MSGSSFATAPLEHGLLVVLSYLAGSVPFSFLVVRLLTGQDVRRVGSGNVGATNALRAGGKKAGALALLLDFGKGVAAVQLARFLGFGEAWVGACALAVVLGHCFPIFLGFRGGKGVATGAGAIGSLALIPFAFCLVIFALVVKLSRYVSLASMTAVATFPLFVEVCGRLGWTRPVSNWFLLACCAIALLIVLKHTGNIRRLLAGTERRLGQPKGAGSQGDRG